jgi:hypothetical protein
MLIAAASWIIADCARADDMSVIVAKLQDPNSDLSNLSREQLTVAAQEDAVRFYDANPNVPFDNHLGEARALRHHLRGDAEMTYDVRFTSAWRALCGGR